MRSLIKYFLQSLYVIPFQTGFALYIIINGIISSHEDSAIFLALMNAIGWGAPLILAIQIFAGVNVLVGSGLQSKNMEAFGLLMAVLLFSLRATIFIMDGDITLQDINATVISCVILLASVCRLHMIYYAKIKRVGIWIKT